MKASIPARVAAKIKMIQGLVAILVQTVDVHGTHKGFSKARAALLLVAGALLARAQDKEMVSGAAAAKADLGSQMVGTALFVAGAIVAYATEAEDSELAKEMHFTKSSFKGREGSVVAKCRTIHAAATENLDELEDNEITAGTLTAFKKQIDAFEALIPKPRNDKVAKVAATKALPKLLRQADTILKKRLDKLVLKFAGENPEFSDKYFAARAIVSPGSRPEKKAEEKKAA